EGFQLAEIADLPDKKRQHYNYQRRSKILIQALQNKKG
ncbi:N-acetylglutamate synthase, partial [Pasteurella multocida subsp. multocida str. Anand1_cattle]